VGLAPLSFCFAQFKIAADCPAQMADQWCLIASSVAHMRNPICLRGCPVLPYPGELRRTPRDVLTTASRLAPKVYSSSRPGGK